MLEASRLLRAIFETGKPVLEVGENGGFVLTYPGTEAYIAWRIADEWTGASTRSKARGFLYLELPPLPIVSINMWYGGGTSGMTLELLMEFLEVMKKYGDYIVTATIINEKVALLFEKMGGMIKYRLAILYIKNGRPAPIPKEWKIEYNSEREEISVEGVLRQALMSIAT